VQLSDDERRVAVEAASALGLQVAGVDLLRSSRGPLLLEVNASPGLEGIEGSTGVDVADAIVAHCEASLAGRPVLPKPRKARAAKGLTAI
jgi:ribosomal protein S6--L-glutamate ligase